MKKIIKYLIFIFIVSIFIGCGYLETPCLVSSALINPFIEANVSEMTHEADPGFISTSFYLRNGDNIRSMKAQIKFDADDFSDVSIYQEPSNVKLFDYYIGDGIIDLTFIFNNEINNDCICWINSSTNMNKFNHDYYELTFSVLEAYDNNLNLVYISGTSRRDYIDSPEKQKDNEYFYINGEYSYDENGDYFKSIISDFSKPFYCGQIDIEYNHFEGEIINVVMMDYFDFSTLYSINRITDDKISITFARTHNYFETNIDFIKIYYSVDDSLYSFDIKMTIYDVSNKSFDSYDSFDLLISASRNNHETEDNADVIYVGSNNDFNNPETEFSKYVLLPIYANEDNVAVLDAACEFDVGLLKYNSICNDSNAMVASVNTKELDAGKIKVSYISTLNKELGELLFTLKFEVNDSLLCSEKSDALLTINFKNIGNNLGEVFKTFETHEIILNYLGRHEIVKHYLAPTCNSEGSEYYDCKICGRRTLNVALPKTDHLFDDWSLWLAPTYDTNGYYTRKCSVCGKTEYQSIPMLTFDDLMNEVRVFAIFFNNSKICGETDFTKANVELWNQCAGEFSKLSRQAKFYLSDTKCSDISDVDIYECIQKYDRVMSLYSGMEDCPFVNFMERSINYSRQIKFVSNESDNSIFILPSILCLVFCSAIVVKKFKYK